jgi:hypothetical protein
MRFIIKLRAQRAIGEKQMSDEVMYSRASSEDDDAFNEWLNSEEKKAADKKAAQEAAKEGGDYDDIKYVGLSKDHPTIVRFVGNFVEEDPLAHRKNPTDMKFMHISKIKGDDGKPFYLYLPLRGDDPEQDHLIWRIVDKVLEKEWIKDPKTGKKVGVEIHAEDHPEIYEMVKRVVTLLLMVNGLTSVLVVGKLLRCCLSTVLTAATIGVKQTNTQSFFQRA